MTEALANLPLPSSVQTHYAFQQIKGAILLKLHQIPGAKDAFKQSYAFAKLVCQMVEELVPAGNSKPGALGINKRQLACDILTSVLELENPLEIAQVGRTIDMVIEGGVKRISIWRKAFRFFCQTLLCRGAPPLLEAPESDEKA
jgi:hypothetical protein